MADRLAELVDVRLASAGVALVTLNLPQVRNAMTTELTAAWTTAMDQVAGDRSLRAVVVTGAGSAFCAGADLSWFDQGNLSDNTPDRLRDKMLPFYRAWLAPQQIPVPVLAAVNGPCIGAGLCLALACDLRYASPSAMFSAPFTQLGTHGGMGVSWLLPEAVGMPRAREMLYTGRVVAADEARSWGLVSEVAEDVVGRTLEVAESVAQAAPIAIRLTKAGLAQGSRGGFEVALQWEALAQPVTMATADIHKGIQARREHRPPPSTAASRPPQSPQSPPRLGRPLPGMHWGRYGTAVLPCGTRTAARHLAAIYPGPTGLRRRAWPPDAGGSPATPEPGRRA